MGTVRLLPTAKEASGLFAQAMGHRLADWPQHVWHIPNDPEKNYTAIVSVVEGQKSFALQVFKPRGTAYPHDSYLFRASTGGLFFDIHVGHSQYEVSVDVSRGDCRLVLEHKAGNKIPDVIKILRCWARENFFDGHVGENIGTDAEPNFAFRGANLAHGTRQIPDAGLRARKEGALIIEVSKMDQGPQGQTWRHDESFVELRHGTYEKVPGSFFEAIGSGIELARRAGLLAWSTLDDAVQGDVQKARSVISVDCAATILGGGLIAGR